MARFSLHTVGKDRPGIIARVTVALAEFGANVEESNMTILHGQSSIMLIVEVPDMADGSHVERALEQVAEELGLFVTVCPLPEDPVAPLGGDSFLISLSGADRPGAVIAGVTTALNDLGANVIDLTSRAVERDGHSSYALRLSVALPADVSLSTLEDVLAALCPRLGVSHSIRPWSGEVIWDAAI